MPEITGEKRELIYWGVNLNDELKYGGDKIKVEIIKASGEIKVLFLGEVPYNKEIHSRIVFDGYMTDKSLVIKP